MKINLQLNYLFLFKWLQSKEKNSKYGAQNYKNNLIYKVWQVEFLYDYKYASLELAW